MPSIMISIFFFVLIRLEIPLWPNCYGRPTILFVKIVKSLVFFFIKKKVLFKKIFLIFRANLYVCECKKQKMFLSRIIFLFFY